MANKAEETIAAGAQGYYLPAANGGERQRALLIHGFTASPSEFRTFSRFLSSNGVSVAAVRLAGHGGSLKTLAKSTYAQWWASARDELQSLSADGPVWVVGNSFGACIALELAARYPQLVAGVVSLGVSLWLYRDVETRIALPFVHLFGGLGRKTYVREEDKPAMAEWGISPYVPSACVYELYAFNRRHVLPALRQVRCPVLLVASREDTVSHTECTQYVADHLGGPVEVELVSGLEHDLLNDPYLRHVVYRRALDFIHRHSPGA